MTIFPKEEKYFKMLTYLRDCLLMPSNRLTVIRLKGDKETRTTNLIPNSGILHKITITMKRQESRVSLMPRMLKIAFPTIFLLEGVRGGSIQTAPRFKLVSF